MRVKEEMRVAMRRFLHNKWPMTSHDALRREAISCRFGSTIILSDWMTRIKAS